MLPSCGHFKNIPCPFYKFALCVRPHCPYKHQTPENQRQLFAPLIDETESLLDTDLSKSSYHDNVSEIQENATYIPTPVDTSSKPQGILKTSNSERPSTSFVPEYKPTPIAKLKEFSTTPSTVRSSKSEYSPEYPVTVRKKKNVEEYDPTEVKCVSKKSVSFADQTDTSDDVPVVLISSDEDDVDTESAPKFSDDDYEEESSVSNTAKQVPEVSIIKEEIIEEPNIDEFSVVDKILVDCKKNELLLNSFKKPKLQAKVSNLSTKANAAEKQTSDKSKAVLSQKSEIKNKNNASTSIKLEKGVIDSKGDVKKTNITKVKKSDNSRKDAKAEKSESSGKSKKVSHSSSTKEKGFHSKETDKSKQSKKVSYEVKKSGPFDNSKGSKSGNHSSNESLHKIKSKKKTEDHHAKQVDRGSSPSKKKSKTENVHSLKSPESSIRSKEKNSNAHPVKRKSIDSDSEHHTSKNKHSYDVKKLKSNARISPLKRTKSIDSDTSDRTNVIAHQNSDLDENEESSYSDSDPDEECRRIFNEFYPEESVSPKHDKEETSPPQSSKSTDLVILRKKRYAHPAAAELKQPSKQSKPEIKKLLNPAQVMHNRFVQFQAKFAQLNDIKDSSKGADKKRINFAPNQNLLDAIRNKNQGNPSLGNFSPLPPTVSKSLKVTKRTAHIPETALKPRPIIPAEYGCKVPANIRQKYLNAFIDECLKFCLSEDEAYDTALEEEKQVYTRSSSKTLYLNIAANALKRLRRKAEEGPEPTGNNSVSSKSNTSKSGQRMVSHETVLNGPLAQRRSYSIARKKEVPEIKGGAALYEYLLTYVLTPEQLKENSYPLPHPFEKDKAVISGAYATRTLYCNDAFKRTCSRCHKTYYVNVDGDYVRDEECDFHWGRLWKKRIAGSIESRYTCCQGDSESDGCCVSPGHVFDGSEAHVLKGYVKTLPKTPPPDNCYGIYALDCEMCYTTAGMELTRITVVDIDSKPVYESFVKPQHKVLDYNTRFSGITEDDLKNVKTTIHDVQAVLLCLFNDKTILIGHSLESDFKALKLFHNTVIDTSVVFPHKNGLPYKRALKTLMAEKLNKIIQNDVGGHDSLEDAVACMELMLWKVREDARSNR